MFSKAKIMRTFISRRFEEFSQREIVGQSVLKKQRSDLKMFDYKNVHTSLYPHELVVLTLGKKIIIF